MLPVAMYAGRRVLVGWLVVADALVSFARAWVWVPSRSWGGVQAAMLAHGRRLFAGR